VSDTSPEQRFRIAVDLAETGLDLMRQNLRRAHPNAGPDEIEAKLNAWRRNRPPDAPGRIVASAT
jgi:hypothetical protein